MAEIKTALAGLHVVHLVMFIFGVLLGSWFTHIRYAAYLRGRAMITQEQFERVFAGQQHPISMAPSPYRLNTEGTVAVDEHNEWLPMDQCPVNVKVQLIGAGGSAVYGEFDGEDKFWRGWAPVPATPEWMKHRVGL